jgi:hypothetical protein
MDPAVVALVERRNRAKEIIAHPQGYALCEGCESIVIRGRSFCPFCLGYRWNYDPVRIRLLAEAVGNRPPRVEIIHWD